MGWSNEPDGKTTDDRNVFVQAAPFDLDSQLLTFSNDKVGVPLNARVFGVKAEMRARATNNNLFSDLSVKLALGGATVDGELARPGGYTTTFEIRIYGGDTNPWGIVLTPTIVNALDFGVAVPAFGIDAVALTVYYCEKAE